MAKANLITALKASAAKVAPVVDYSVKPEWYNVQGELAWENLDEENRKSAIDNPEATQQALASMADGFPPDAQPEPDKGTIPADVETWIEREAKRIDAAAIAAVVEGVELKGKARKVTLTLAQDQVQRLYGDNGRGMAGNEPAIPLVGSAEDLFTVPAGTSKNPNKVNTLSRVALLWERTFGKALIAEITALEDIKSRTVEQNGKLDALRKQRRDSKDYWLPAVELVQKIWLVNQNPNARAYFSDDETTLRGPTPIIMCELATVKIPGKGMVPGSPKGHKFLSVDAFNRLGTRVDKDEQGNVIKTYPIDKTLSYKELEATAPKTGGKREPAKGQGGTGKDTEGLKAERIQSPKQWEGAFAEMAAATEDDDLKLSMVATINSPDMDELISSVRLVRAFCNTLLSGPVVARRLAEIVKAEKAGQAKDTGEGDQVAA